jgi:hypothetical protein
LALAFLGATEKNHSRGLGYDTGAEIKNKNNQPTNKNQKKKKKTTTTKNPPLFMRMLQRDEVMRQ